MRPLEVGGFREVRPGRATAFMRAMVDSRSLARRVVADLTE